MASGPAGAEVTVNGYSVSGRVEVRWNALDGPLLATAQGPSFSAPAKIPAADPGLYTVLVLERGSGGALGSTGRAAFQVTSGTTPRPSPDRPSMTPTTATPTSSSTSVPAAAAAVGGAALLTLGAIGGAFAARRRSRPTAA